MLFWGQHAMGGKKRVEAQSLGNPDFQEALQRKRCHQKKIEGSG